MPFDGCPHLDPLLPPSSSPQPTQPLQLTIMSCLADFAIVSAAFYLAYVTAGAGGLQAPSETATTESSSSAVSSTGGTGLSRNQRQTVRFNPIKASVPALERPLPIMYVVLISPARHLAPPDSHTYPIATPTRAEISTSHKSPSRWAIALSAASAPTRMRMSLACPAR